MACQIRVFLTDDIDGSDADRTVEFSLGSASYSIDLSDANAAKLEEALAPFIAKAQRVGRTRKAAAPGRGANTAAVRVWARENGFEVSDRGRVPANVLEAYNAAH